MEEIEGVPDTSSNLGMIRFDSRTAEKDGGVKIELRSFVRSMTPARHDEVISAHRREAQFAGFKEEIDEYGTWLFHRENRLISTAAEIYRDMTGQEPEITAVHVGLEPSAFSEKAPHLQMINVGMDIADPHTVHERIYIDTIRPFALFMKQLLEKISSF